MLALAVVKIWPQISDIVIYYYYKYSYFKYCHQSLLKVHLQLRGFSVFLDIEKLAAGKFDEGLVASIQSSKNFILVLTPNALDRCIGDTECKDWIHKVKW